MYIVMFDYNGDYEMEYPIGPFNNLKDACIYVGAVMFTALVKRHPTIMFEHTENREEEDAQWKGTMKESEHMYVYIHVRKLVSPEVIDIP